jgi:ornithine carbamoyltransferase
MRHVVSFKDWTEKELLAILDLAERVKKNPQEFRTALENQTLLMLFQKTSTRTRVSFEAGMTELGGHAIYLDWRSSNIPITDLKIETRYLSRNCSFLMARLLKHADMVAMAESATVPVINGLDDRFHPTQCLSDFFTIREKAGKLKGVKLAYVGIQNNVSNSLVTLGCKLGVDVTLVTPLVNEASRDEELMKWAKATGHLRETTDLKAAVKDADVVYTDTWLDMEFFSDSKYAGEKQKREKTMLPYQISRANMASSKARIMHDLPVHFGYEMEQEIFDDPRSIILDQGENLRHARKAILLTLFEGKAKEEKRKIW